MFSAEEKGHISKMIANVLWTLHHPEMGDKPPRFKLHVDGAESWSWADIVDPTTFAESGSPVNPNPWNEVARENLK